MHLCEEKVFCFYLRENSKIYSYVYCWPWHKIFIYALLVILRMICKSYCISSRQFQLRQNASFRIYAKFSLPRKNDNKQIKIWLLAEIYYLFAKPFLSNSIDILSVCSIQCIFSGSKTPSWMALKCRLWKCIFSLS